MPLSGEVENELGIDHAAGVENKHVARLNFLALACADIFIEVGGPCTLELQSDALAHEANSIHRVHQRLGVGMQ